jgi:hypothetical protein
VSRLFLESPGWLWLLLCAPYLVIAAVRSVTDASPGRRVAQTLVRLLFVALAALVLAGPALRQEETAVSAVVLIDGSSSITDAQLADETRMAEALRAAAGPRKASVRLVRFGAEPEEIAAAGAGRPAHPGDTDIGQALGLGLGLLDPTRVPRFLLLSDGRPTRGDALAAGERAAARGARLFFHQPGRHPCGQRAAAPAARRAAPGQRARGVVEGGPDPG